ncbi:MAG: DUF2812 domain-containing protein [Lachnospiraceae bacterium]|nr:DUF2812 domain-containing protein [Lachnospiraceae bacterium]
MSDTKLKIRFYTIADFNEEEIWLREEHKKGWRLSKMVPPCFYHFEKCEPEDVIYRLDYKNNKENEDYMQMIKDFGWEYVGKCVGWLYFRKSASSVVNENDGEIFSDNASRSSMVEHIMKTRMMPIMAIFFCCVIPNALRAADDGVSAFFAVFWLVMLAIYIYLLVHCGLKLKKMKDNLE